MIKEMNSNELEEALTLLNYYDQIETFSVEKILEDINEEVHSSKFLQLINRNNDSDI